MKCEERRENDAQCSALGGEKRTHASHNPIDRQRRATSMLQGDDWIGTA